VVVFACVVLPAARTLSLTSDSGFWAPRLHRWVVLTVELGFVLPIAYCGLLKLTYLSTFLIPGNIQIFAALVGCTFGLRWVLIDQRQRCPVCLRVLTKPARVGSPARNFLAWNGTELMCAKGHGLLHVPESPTSWFSTQRWLYLDPSWSGLFS
jgi:hypothetical protein